MNLLQRIHNEKNAQTLEANIASYNAEINDFLNNGGGFAARYYNQHVGRELNKKLKLFGLEKYFSSNGGYNGISIHGPTDGGGRPFVAGGAGGGGMVPDSDGDGVDDNSDAFPNDSTETTDSDGDGVGDNADAFPNDSTETLDFDGDGVGNNAESTHGTDPFSSDTDSDGLDDYDEINNLGTDPTIDDTDGDGLTDGEEVNTYSTDPTTDDTDGDGFFDGEEVAQGSDPSDSSSFPVTDADGDGVDDNIDPNTVTFYATTTFSSSIDTLTGMGSGSTLQYAAKVASDVADTLLSSKMDYVWEIGQTDTPSYTASGIATGSGYLLNNFYGALTGSSNPDLNIRHDFLPNTFFSYDFFVGEIMGSMYGYSATTTQHVFTWGVYTITIQSSSPTFNFDQAFDGSILENTIGTTVTDGNFAGPTKLTIIATQSNNSNNTATATISGNGSIVDLLYVDFNSVLAQYPDLSV